MDGETITVRPARPDDVVLVGAITEAAYRDDGHLDLDGGDAYAVHLRDVARRMEEGTVLVADLDGTAVGSVTLAPHGTPWCEVARPGEVEVRMLSVAADARRRGVAEALMAAVEAEAAATGHDAVVLSTMERMLGAQRLYARLGYTRQPQRDWDIDHDDDVAAHMLAYRKSVAAG